MQLNEKLFARVVMIIGTIIRSAHHHHQQILPVPLPELPVADRRLQRRLVGFDPGAEIDGRVFEGLLHNDSPHCADRSRPIWR